MCTADGLGGAWEAGSLAGARRCADAGKGFLPPPARKEDAGNFPHCTHTRSNGESGHRRRRLVFASLFRKSELYEALQASFVLKKLTSHSGRVYFETGVENFRAVWEGKRSEWNFRENQYLSDILIRLRGERANSNSIADNEFEKQG